MTAASKKPVSKKPAVLFKGGQWNLDLECSMLVMFFLVPVIFYSVVALKFLVDQLRASYAHPVEEVVNGKKKVKSRAWTYVAIAILLFVIAFCAWNIIYPPKGDKCKDVIRVVLFIVIIQLITGSL